MNEWRNDHAASAANCSTSEPTRCPSRRACGEPLVAYLVRSATPYCKKPECNRARLTARRARGYESPGAGPARDAAKAATRRRRAVRKLAVAAEGTSGALPIASGPCGWCGDVFAVRIRSDPPQWCSERCKRRAVERRRVTRQHGGTGWRWSDFMRMARSFGYCCAYCGTKPDRLDPDHVVPLARGGDDSLSNLLPTCLLCNSDKRDLLLDEWREDRATRRLPPRNTSADYPHLALPTPTGCSWSRSVA